MTETIREFLERNGRRDGYTADEIAAAIASMEPFQVGWRLDADAKTMSNGDLARIFQGAFKIAGFT